MALVDVWLRSEASFTVAELAAKSGAAVVLMTADPKTAEALQAFELPVISKPFNPGDLIENLSAAVSIRETEELRTMQILHLHQFHQRLKRFPVTSIRVADGAASI